MAARPLLWLLPALAAILLAGASPASDHDRPQGTFNDRLEVVEGAIEVTVTDRRGEPVLGLGPRDFLVRQRGREVKVVGVAYESYRSPPATPDPPVAVARSAERPAFDSQTAVAHRCFVVLIHDLLFLSDRATLGVLSQRMRTLRGLRRWVEEELAATDLVALAVYHGRLQPYLDLTASRGQISGAIERIAARQPPLPARPAPPGRPSLLRHLPEAGELRDQTASLSRGLLALARAAAPIRGRKHLLLFSIGTGLDEGSPGLFDRSPAPGLLQSLNRASMVTHALDLTPAAVEHARASSLISLAEATGGTYHGHVESFHKPLRAISRQAGGYYVLSYLPLPGSARGDRRRIDVRVRRRGLRVSVRGAFADGPG